MLNLPFYNQQKGTREHSGVMVSISKAESNGKKMVSSNRTGKLLGCFAFVPC